MSATGESDLMTYYDGIAAPQEKDLRSVLMSIFDLLCPSVLGKPRPPEFSFTFNSLWKLKEEQRASVAQQDIGTIVQAVGAGVYTPVQALKEIRQLSAQTGRGTSITDDDIAAAEQASAAMAAPQPDGMGGDRKYGEEDLEWRTTEDGHHFAFTKKDGVIRAGFAGKLNGKKLSEAIKTMKVGGKPYEVPKAAKDVLASEGNARGKPGGEGGESFEDYPDQIPLMVEDIKHIPDILANFDTVKLVDKKDGHEKFLFRKRVNGHYVTIEEVRDRSRKDEESIPRGTGKVKGAGAAKPEENEKREGTAVRPKVPTPLGLTPRGNIHIQTDYAHKHLAKQVPGALPDGVDIGKGDRESIDPEDVYALAAHWDDVARLMKKLKG
jgi:hypothetical protein